MGWPFSSTPAFCARDFPQLWTSFVHAFIDASHADGPVAPRPIEQVEPPPTVLPAVPRIVAVGDLHGDLNKTRRAFRIAGLIDERDRWVGGTMTVVQVGDILDRGDQELQVFFWLERLQREAARAGGAVHVLNGNHETMNVAGQFRYATLGGLLGFGRWRELAAVEGALKSKCGCAAAPTQQLLASLRGMAGAAPSSSTSSSGSSEVRSARVAALQPGGEVTRRFLAPHPTVLQVGSTLFVHGGVLPQHVEYGLERINRETQAWMLGHGPGGASDGSSGGGGSGGGSGAPTTPSPGAAHKPKFLSGRSAVVWARHYSAEDAAHCDCATLAEALRGVPGAQRMVVGHTIQERGINSACEGQVYRIDVGMSKGCGGNAPEVLEILHDREVRRITEIPAAPTGGSSSSSSKGKEKENVSPLGAGSQQQHKVAPVGSGVAAAAATALPAS